VHGSSFTLHTPVAHLSYASRLPQEILRGNERYPAKIHDSAAVSLSGRRLLRSRLGI